jgi:hypothetical protein
LRQYRTVEIRRQAAFDFRAIRGFDYLPSGPLVVFFQQADFLVSAKPEMLHFPVYVIAH